VYPIPPTASSFTITANQVSGLIAAALARNAFASAIVYG